MPSVAVPMVGAFGVVYGVTPDDDAEAALLPIELMARTVKVYEVPGVRPVKEQLRAFTLVQPEGAVTNGLDVTE